jgi:hypothetical protein
MVASSREEVSDEEWKLDMYNLESKNNMLSRNVGYKSPSDASPRASSMNTSYFGQYLLTGSKSVEMT